MRLACRFALPIVPKAPPKDRFAMPVPTILSFQSRVAAGHVGGAAASPVLQMLGCEVIEVPTVILSAHPGHGRPGGGALPAALLAGIIDGLERVGRLDGIDGVIVGYLGTVENGVVAAATIERVRARNPKTCVLVDPVIGDRDGGRYVADGILECFRDRLIPLADIVKPNHFELEALTGRPIASLDEAAAALEALKVPLPLVTSLEWGGDLATLALIGGRRLLALTKPVARPPHGLGDTLGAVLMAHLARGLAPEAALARAIGAVEALIGASLALGLDELPLVAAAPLVTHGPPHPLVLC